MNTMDLLQTKIDDARMNLPELSRKAIDAVGWKKIIFEMKGYTPGQLEELETETELLLYGLMLPENYPKELENRMKISRSQADILVNNMNDLIFKRIKDELEKNIGSNDDNNELPVPLPPNKIPHPPPASAMPEALRAGLTPSPSKGEGGDDTPPPNLPIAPQFTSPQPSHPPLPNPLLANEREKSTMESAGVEIIPDTAPASSSSEGEERKMTMGEDRLLVKSGINVIEDNPTNERSGHLLPNEATQKESLEGIEHPQNANPNIISQKLGGAVSSSIKTTDYTVNKPSQGLNKDPYRETL